MGFFVVPPNFKINFLKKKLIKFKNILRYEKNNLTISKL